VKTAPQMADNWAQAMGNPQTASKYKQGIQSTTVNPMAMAATPEAMNLYATRVQESVTSGRRAQKLNAVPVDRWKNNAVNVGSTQLTVGATKAKAKVQEHFNRWASVYAQAHDAAAALPKGGEANALARVAAAMRVMMQAAGRA